jgi:hypothetical protein
VLTRDSTMHLLHVLHDQRRHLGIRNHHGDAGLQPAVVLKRSMPVKLTLAPKSAENRARPIPLRGPSVARGFMPSEAWWHLGNIQSFLQVPSSRSALSSRREQSAGGDCAWSRCTWSRCTSTYAIRNLLHVVHRSATPTAVLRPVLPSRGIGVSIYTTLQQQHI